MATTGPASGVTPRMNAVTRTLIWRRLLAFCDEMGLILTRSCYSPMIRDVRDYVTGLVTADGETIVINAGGSPSHFAELGYVILDAVAQYGADDFAPGDAVMTNHAFVTGQHVNNVQISTPIFHDSRLVGWAASFAHWQDIGGITANRPTAGTTDSYQEGLQVRSVKVYKAGEPREDVLRLILGNLRQPEVGHGDLRAQVASCRVGEDRFQTLLSEFSLETVKETLGWIREETSQLAGDAVERIPDGTYRASSFLDEDGFDSERRVPIEVRVDVSGRSMVVDFEGTSMQARGPINSRSNAPANVIFKALATPDRPLTVGDLDPLTVVAAEGSMLRARMGAPMGSWSWPFPTMMDTILRALQPALPGEIAAGNCGAMYGAGFFFGEHPETKRTFVSLNLVPVGWGARPTADGVTAHGMFLSQIEDTPAEVSDMLAPLVVEEVRFLCDSGGPGRFRGGLGVEYVTRCLADTFANFEVDRTHCLPWGIEGGGSGRPGRHHVILPDGTVTHPPARAMNHLVPAGSRVVVATGGGGGYGHPHEREPERVLNDVIDGYVSQAAAASSYGVAVVAGATALEVDPEHTRQLRG